MNEPALTTPDLTNLVEPPLILFDGICNLCSASVNFVIDRDPNARFRFAALQSDAGARALAAHGMLAKTGDPESIVLVENGRVFQRSSAALRVARALSGPWKLLYIFIVVPAFLRDSVYTFIARNRYRWFGKADKCRVPTPELRARFLT
jgi:predicted DCC family thiol-disulfide oxidoreductase YuxK